jgi:hypothetical protein
MIPVCATGAGASAMTPASSTNRRYVRSALDWMSTGRLDRRGATPDRATLLQ